MGHIIAIAPYFVFVVLIIVSFFAKLFVVLAICIITRYNIAHVKIKII